MDNKKNSVQKQTISNLQKLRLVLVGLAVILAIALGIIYMTKIHQSKSTQEGFVENQQEEFEQEENQEEQSEKDSSEDSSEDSTEKPASGESENDHSRIDKGADEEERSLEDPEEVQTKPSDESSEEVQTQPSEEPSEEVQTQPSEEPSEEVQTQPSEEPSEEVQTQPSENIPGETPQAIAGKVTDEGTEEKPQGNVQNGLEDGDSGNSFSEDTEDQPNTKLPDTQPNTIEPENKQNNITPQNIMPKLDKDSESEEFLGEEDGEAQIPAVFWILCGVLAADLAAIAAVSVLISKYKKLLGINDGNKAVEEVEEIDFWSESHTFIRTDEKLSTELCGVGKIHNIGARPYQEDSIGMRVFESGYSLAVVADGMGGLSNGDKVSKKIVSCMLAYGEQVKIDQIDRALEAMVQGVNEEVNRMLGPSGIYKSGSTLLAVLVYKDYFYWTTVGDSHIYLYRDGQMKQLNREHTVEQELLVKAANGEITYEEVQNSRYKNRVTSFIGMGKLKYVEKNTERTYLQPGDRILLMSDGVFNALSDQTMAEVLQKYQDVEEAAFEMEQLVIKHGNPKQDNFSAIILGF